MEEGNVFCYLCWFSSCGYSGFKILFFLVLGDFCGLGEEDRFI